MEVKSFVSQVLARLKGDEDQVIAERNFRKATSAVRGQISTLEGKKVDAEIAVEESAEALMLAKYPTTLISSSENYLSSIRLCEETLEFHQDSLNEVVNSIKYFTNLKKEFNQ